MIELNSDYYAQKCKTQNTKHKRNPTHEKKKRNLKQLTAIATPVRLLPIY
jgi:hypothetical protein